jgi:hypothetical protein
MKKLFLFVIILITSATNLKAQTIFTYYAFNVEPKDANTVLNLYKEYFSNKPSALNGITVSLYQNHFAGKDVPTHEIVFTGTPENLGAAYDSKSTDAWSLLQSELSKYTTEVNAGMGESLSVFGDANSEKYPIQDVYLISIKDKNLFKAKFDAFWSKNNSKDARMSFGSLNTNGADGVTNYVVRSYKNFTDEFTDDASSLNGYSEYMNSVKDIRTVITTRTRILLGKW